MGSVKEEKDDFPLFFDSVEKLSLLQKNNSYSHKESKNCKKFTYEHNNKNMNMLREKYKLEMIAGNGNDMNKIFRLMRWLNKLINPFKPIVDNPESIIVSELIDFCLKGFSLNCAGYARVLNEMYLSLGWKSRFIACLPADINDNECHFVTLVFIDDFYKWIIVDAAFGCCIADNNNIFLDLREFRLGLIYNKEMKLLRNINTICPSISYQKYMNYMSKNVFMFHSWMHYGCEQYNNASNEALLLVPIGYKTDLKERRKFQNILLTDNEDFFWQKP